MVMLKKEIILTPQELRQNKVIYKKICFEKPESAVIIGKVTDENRKPIAYAAVMVYIKNMAGYGSTMDYLGYTKTDLNGVFIIFIKSVECVDYIIAVYEPLKE
ncbi:hypothetical protein [Tepidibacter sp. Z1-5]|uniref:hypothetical protein n=1 Tax=Tepidibacter sp. Z1-5 TaxID=3134138 RepID=UPI0030BD44FB